VPSGQTLSGFLVRILGDSETVFNFCELYIILWTSQLWLPGFGWKCMETFANSHTVF